MDALITLLILVFGIMTVLLLRTLTVGGRAPLTRQAVRHLFRQQVLALCDNAVLVKEEDDEITFQIGEAVCAVKLEQLFRRCVELPSRTGLFIRQAAQAIQRTLLDPDGLGDQWRRQVVPQLLRVDMPLPEDAVTHPIAGQLQVGYVLDGMDAFRWVTRRMLTVDGVSAETLHDAALLNLERSCNMLVIDAVRGNREDHDRLLRFLTADGLDAARLLLPSFYERFSPRFGDTDLLVMIPSRDTLVMVGEKDQAYITWLARHGDGVSFDRAYPLFDQPLKVTEQGIEPV